MPRRTVEFRTKIARLRVGRGFSQQKMATLTGISLRTYKALEGGEFSNPKLGYLVNCALVFQTDLAGVCEDSWLAWQVFDQQHAAEPPRWAKRSLLPDDSGA